MWEGDYKLVSCMTKFFSVVVVELANYINLILSLEWESILLVFNCTNSRTRKYFVTLLGQNLYIKSLQHKNYPGQLFFGGFFSFLREQIKWLIIEEYGLNLYEFFFTCKSFSYAGYFFNRNVMLS